MSKPKSRLRAQVNRCFICGIYETVAALVSSSDKNRCLNFPDDYMQCQDERECVRRSEMKMGPGRPWPGPTL